MTMSRDRIEFTLTTGAAYDDDAAGKVARAASRAFNIPNSLAVKYLREQKRLRVRPSQFGLFIVLRVEEGLSNNRIAALNAKIIPGGDDDVGDLSTQEAS